MDHEIANQFDAVLDDTLSTLDTVVEAYATAEGEKLALQQKVADHDKILLQKVAEAKNVFNEGELSQLLDKLTAIGIIPEGYQSKVASRLRNNPGSVLAFVDQITESMIGVPSEGFGIAKSGSDVVDSDPDGWDAYISGRPVPRK